MRILLTILLAPLIYYNLKHPTYQDELAAKRTGHGDDHLITMRGLKHEQGRGQAYVRLN